MIRQLLNWFRRGHLESGLDRELKYHVDRRVSDLMDSGLPEPEARRQATWSHALLVPVRAWDEKDFGPSTRKVSVEVWIRLKLSRSSGVSLTYGRRTYAPSDAAATKSRNSTTNSTAG